MNKRPIEDAFGVYIEGMKLMAEPDTLDEDVIEQARMSFFAGAIAMMRVVTAMQNEVEGVIVELQELRAEVAEQVRKMRH